MSYLSEDDSWDSHRDGPPSVSRDGFTFEGGKFYTSFDRWPRHVRAEPAELYRLLTYAPPPVKMTKAGTVAKYQPKNTHKDPEQHYYAAQMIHYGLKPLKTKAPAKKKLLAAFGDSQTLQVPKAILELEAAMKKEWEKLNTEYTASQERLRVLQETRDEEFRIHVAKEAELRARQPNPVVPPPAPSPKKQTGGALSIEQRVNALNMPKPKSADVRPKMTLNGMQTSIGSLSLVQARQLLVNLLDKSPTVRNAVETELALIKEPNTISEPPSVDRSTWTGLYYVEIPSKMDEIEYSLEDELTASSLTFEVYPSSTSSHLWASFDFGLLSGFMRSINPVPKSLNTEVHFEYRGRERGEDIMTFDDKSNRAIVTFLPGGLFEGEIDTDCFGNFKIYGALRNKDNGKTSQSKTTAQQKAAVKEWKAGYRRINAHNYEVENGGRWPGQWGGEYKYKDDQAFESDTTAGKQKHRQVDLTNFLQSSKDEERYGGSEDEEYGFQMAC